ncbi:MAG: trehalose-phosphatase [Candidatus Aquicultor sp.]
MTGIDKELNDELNDAQYDVLYEALAKWKEHPEKSGIFSDLDGTLSKIAPTPAEAIVTAEMRKVLQDISDKYAVAGIVSGRDSTEARRIIALDNLIYIGNHGLEWLEGGKQFYAPEAFNFFGLAGNLAAELSAIFDDTGYIVERKKLGVAVHYRQVGDKEQAKARIEEAIEPMVAKYPLKRSEGRYVIELKPDLPVNKGDAVTVIALRTGIERAMYLGDDVTDIDAFQALGRLRDQGRMQTVSIAIASDESAPAVMHEADYVVQSVDAAEDLLRWISS